MHSHSIAPPRSTSAAELQSASRPYSSIGFDPARSAIGHLDEHLDRLVVLDQLAEHLLVVVEPLDSRGEELLEPSGVYRGRLREVVYAGAEVVRRCVDAPDHDLVAQHEALVDHVRVDLCLPIASGDADQHQDAVLAERLGGLEHERAEPRLLDDEVERTEALRSLGDRGLLGAYVSGAELLDQLA